MENPREDREGEGGSHRNYAGLAHSKLVPLRHEDVSGLPAGIPSRASSPAEQTSSLTPSARQSHSGGAPLIREALQQFTLCPLSEQIVMSSWRNNTHKRYATTIKKWDVFCKQKQIDPLHPNLTEIIQFLTLLFREGRGHRAICAARSALNSIIHTQGHRDLSMHPLLTRFCKGVFNLRPPPMKRNETWDPTTLLDFINGMGENATLTLQQLTYKTVGLLMLLSGSRVHCIHAFSTLCMTRSEGLHTIYPTVFNSCVQNLGGTPLIIEIIQTTKICVLSRL